MNLQGVSAQVFSRHLPHHPDIQHARKSTVGLRRPVSPIDLSPIATCIIIHNSPLQDCTNCSTGEGSRTLTVSRPLDFKSSAATITPLLHMRETAFMIPQDLLSRSPCISFYWNLRATMFTPLTSGERSISLLWEELKFHDILLYRP